MHLLLIFISCILVRSSVSQPATQVVSVHRNQALLYCVVPKELRFQNTSVSWMGPNELVVIGNEVVPKYKDIIELVGDRQGGEHHVRIKFTKFPDHVGLWLCMAGHPVHFVSKTNLTLLVPPDLMLPSISPKNVMGTHSLTEALTVTCSGHYSLPPLDLKWTKNSGPDVEFEVSPPSYIVSRKGLISVSVKLILTNQNVGSVFQCSSYHPTHNGSSSSVFEFLDNPNHVMSGAWTSSQEKSVLAVLSSSDKALMFIFIIFICSSFLTLFFLHKCRNKWNWKRDPLNISEFQQNFSGEPQENNNLKEDSEVKSNTKIKSGQLTNKIACFCLLLSLLCLLLTLPVHFKGLELPSPPNVDQMMAAFAGSSLWLDCRNLFQASSLIRVTWSFNDNVFFHQYFSNKANIGYLHNSTVGFEKGSRVSSQSPGQIVLWPIMPGEDGMYSCDVLTFELIDKTVSHKKTFLVHVLTKPQANPVLIALIIISIICSFTVLLLIMHNCIKISPRSKTADKSFVDKA